MRAIPAGRGRETPLAISVFAELALHSTLKHLDPRPFRAVGQIETYDFRLCFVGSVIESKDRLARWLEKRIAGAEVPGVFSVDLKGEAAPGDDTARRDRMSMQSGGLAW